jgi:phenylacetate-CoA ligase
LHDLAGRPPVRFRAMDGGWINNVDVTHALNRFPLAQYALHQDAGGALTLRVRGPLAGEGDLRAALRGLFGEAQPLAVERVDAFEGKVVQYTSGLAGATA